MTQNASSGEWRVGYWEVLGGPADTYTPYMCSRIVNVKTQEDYTTGRARLFKKNDQPKNIIRAGNPDYAFYQLNDKKPTTEKRIVGLFKRQKCTVYQFGYCDWDIGYGSWYIPELEMFTLHACSWVRNKKTRKEYAVGPFQFYPSDMEFIPFVEDFREEYEYIYKDSPTEFHPTTDDMVKEIMVSQWLKK